MYTVHTTIVTCAKFGGSCVTSRPAATRQKSSKSEPLRNNYLPKHHLLTTNRLLLLLRGRVLLVLGQQCCLVTLGRYAKFPQQYSQLVQRQAVDIFASCTDCLRAAWMVAAFSCACFSFLAVSSSSISALASGYPYEVPRAAV